MASTSLWHIAGRLSDLIDYVEDPEKTIPKDQQDFFNVFSYVQRADKTKDEYVTAINCLKNTALQQMILTKKQYGKDDGYIAWHGYQSFKPGEVSPDICHKIGVELAKEMWGDRFQIIVTTHLDKGHLHNHFCFNSVSYLDGGKYNYSKKERQRMMQISDRLCFEYGLSVISNPHKAPSRPVWLAEKNGKPTRYNIYRADVQAAIDGSRSPVYMERYLNRLGYITDFAGAHWKIRLPQYEHFTRLDTLNPDWTRANIPRTMGCYASFGNQRAQMEFSPFLPEEYRSYYTPHKPTTQIYRLYLYYCYQLGILPEHRDFKPVSPYLKEDLRRLDELTAQVDYMSCHGIKTIDDLYADRAKLEGEVEKLIACRRKLENKIRRASPNDKEALRREKADITTQITSLRKRLKCNHQIEVRSARIQENLDLAYDNELRAKEQQFNKTIRKEYER
ncbi:MAG: hypothetical protein EOM54_10635 [Clostridia bacterium]|nr:hypothetical protein [Clostridia bacterium]